jgi:hypothetical protein
MIKFGLIFVESPSRKSCRQKNGASWADPVSLPVKFARQLKAGADIA